MLLKGVRHQQLAPADPVGCAVNPRSAATQPEKIPAQGLTLPGDVQVVL
jgi:hypothetical protein